MNLAERIALELAAEPRLANIPIPVIEEVIAQAVDALARMEWPDGVTLADALESDWEVCEGCCDPVPFDEVKRDSEGVPLCPPCMAELIAEGKPAT